MKHSSNASLVDKEKISQQSSNLLHSDQNNPLQSDKFKDKTIQSAIDRLLNRKIENGAKTIKLISCKKETVNMLNRIGLPLAKKIKRQKQLQLRKELKDQIERETQELLLYSKPEVSKTLVVDFLANEEQELAQRRNQLYSRLSDGIITTPKQQRIPFFQRNLAKGRVNSVLNSPLNFSQDISLIDDHQDKNFERLQVYDIQASKRRLHVTSQSNQREKLIQKSLFSKGRCTQSQLRTKDESNINDESTYLQTHTTQQSIYTNLNDVQLSLSKKHKLQEIKEEIQIFQDDLKGTSQTNQKPQEYKIQVEMLRQSKIKIENGDQSSCSSDTQTQNKYAQKPSINEQLFSNVQKLNVQESLSPQEISQQKRISIVTDFQYSELNEQIKTFDLMEQQNIQNKDDSLRERNNMKRSKNFENSHKTQQTQFIDIIILLKKNISKIRFTMQTPNVSIFNKFNLQQLKKQFTGYQQKTATSIENQTNFFYDELFLTIEHYQNMLDSLNSTKTILKRKVQLSPTQDSKLQQTLNQWQQVIDISQKLGDFILQFHALQVKGEIFLEFKDFQKALKAYHQLKNFCDEKKRFKEKIICYEQMGICHRLLEDHISAIQFFRKQLELAWEQKDEKAEVCACENLALEYYYLGDLEKAQHFNDRMMRGKHETDQSVIKRVSKNLILSKRKRAKYEYYLNPDLLQEHLNKKQSQNASQNVSVDFGLSKAYQLLPHFYTKEEDDMPANEDQDSNQKNCQKKLKLQISHGPNFITPELSYLNSPPAYQYLQEDKLSKRKKKKYYFRASVNSSLGRQALKSKMHHMSLRDYIGQENFKYDINAIQKQKLVDGEELYNRILERVRLQSDRGAKARSQTSGHSTISHQSLLRTMPKQHIIYGIAIDSLEKSLDLFKQIMKKQMLILVRKLKLGIEYEEIVYNV